MSLPVQKQDPLPPRERAKKLGLQSSRFDHKHMSQTAEDQISFIKKKHRPQISHDEWRPSKYYKTNATQLLFDCPDQIPRIHCNNLSVPQFIQQYQSQNKPLIIQGVTDDWEVPQHWQLDKFYSKCKEVEFKAGEDSKGKKLRIKLKYYLQYLIYNKDDSPLYLFESSLESRKDTKQIIDWYKVPKYFQDDLFGLAGSRHRPPYRWLLIGPERSGTTVHIDPLHTSAWNTSLAGHKRWVIFKEEVPKFIVKGLEFKKPGEDIEAIDYFTRILPKIIEKQGRSNLGIQEFIQYPGETVFIPGGWWHAVINLDDTFAVTQNVMTHTNFDLVWTWLRKERPKFGAYFLKQLQKKKKYLYEKALELNQRDNWLMGMRNKRCSLSRSPSDSSSSSSSSEYSSSSSSQASSPKNRKSSHNPSRSRSRNRHKESSRKT